MESLNKMKDDLIGTGAERKHYESEMAKVKDLTLIEFAMYFKLDSADTVFLYEWIDNYATKMFNDFKESFKAQYSKSIMN